MAAPARHSAAVIRTPLGRVVFVLPFIWLVMEMSTETGCCPRVSPRAARHCLYSPVPVRVAVCGLPDALSLTWRVALYAVPLLCGENVTLMVQLAPTASVPPQVVLRL